MAVEEKFIYAYALKNALAHEGKAAAGNVISGLFNHGLEKSGVKEIMPRLNAIVKEVNSWDLEKQNAEFEKYAELVGHRPEREGLPELPSVGPKGVVMRFAPAPSGPLHLGHVIAGIPTSLYVEKYGGKFYVRIEDTNPESTVFSAYGDIKRDLDWLFGNVTEYVIQSDRMQKYYDYARKLIEKGKGYVCTCDNEKFKNLVVKKKECPCRKLNVKENSERWGKMLSGEFKEGEAVLRFAGDLENPNPALRDFPLARINAHEHPRQGKKFRVWPLMNLSVTVDDIELGMTHIIRGKDHKDNSLRQKMMYEVLGMENFPVVLFVGRIKFTDVILSKRKIKAAIEEGDYEGWDDVRLPTIASLRKRGYLPEAFKEFAIQRGISEVDKVITQKELFEIINNFNRAALREKTRKVSFAKSDEKKANIIVVMPDASKIFGSSEVSPKNEEIVYFDDFGYARFNGKKDGKLEFYFAHD